MEYKYRCFTPIGPVMLTSDGTSLTGLHFIEHAPADMAASAGVTADALEVFRLTQEWLRIFFGGKAPDFTPPLSLRGSTFGKKVWEILLAVPYGKTVSYGEIARRISQAEGGRRVAAQAVGGAVGRNPIAIIVPCHRVIGANGGMVGYGGGLHRKEALLKLEGAV